MKTDFRYGGLIHRLIAQRLIFGLYELWNDRTNMIDGYTLIKWEGGKYPQQRFLSSHYTRDKAMVALSAATIGPEPGHTARLRCGNVQ